MNTFGHIFKLDAYSNKYAQFKEGSSKLYSINSSYLVYRKLLWGKKGGCYMYTEPVSPLTWAWALALIRREPLPSNYTDL